MSAAVMAMRKTFSCACTAKLMALKPTPMAKVMADGAEAPKMGKLNRFMRTPFVMFKNLSQNLYGSHRNNCLQHTQIPVQLLVCNQYATNTSHGRTNTRQFDGYAAPLKIKVRTFIGFLAPK
jgi:hypothetical protein